LSGEFSLVFSDKYGAISFLWDLPTMMGKDLNIRQKIPASQS